MITLDNISITAGTFQIEHVSLKVPHRSYGILMGATGSGKTTLLEAIAGINTDHQWLDYVRHA